MGSDIRSWSKNSSSNQRIFGTCLTDIKNKAEHLTYSTAGRLCVLSVLRNTGGISVGGLNNKSRSNQVEKRWAGPVNESRLSQWISGTFYFHFRCISRASFIKENSIEFSVRRSEYFPRFTRTKNSHEQIHMQFIYSKISMSFHQTKLKSIISPWIQNPKFQSDVLFSILTMIFTWKVLYNSLEQRNTTEHK